MNCSLTPSPNFDPPLLISGTPTEQERERERELVELMHLIQLQRLKLTGINISSGGSSHSWPGETSGRAEWSEQCCGGWGQNHASLAKWQRNYRNYEPHSLAVNEAHLFECNPLWNRIMKRLARIRAAINKWPVRAQNKKKKNKE